MAKEKTITVELPILPEQAFVLHQNLASATLEDGVKVEVSGGFGLGNAYLHVSLDGKRIITVDGAPLLRVLMDTAIEKQTKKVKNG